MKALVIDDEPDVLEVVSLTFDMRWPDSSIVSALDGDTGIQMVDTESPSLVILDVGLPDMDGFTVCQGIRRFSDVPIIMLTVRDRESDIVRGLQLGRR
jgi:two-component system, OmpR family, KDP operon response regulator KdpE